MRSRTLTLLLLSLASLSPALLALDNNANGISDVWERYGAGNNPTLDPDRDGFNNAAEEQAGTNPMDAADRFAVANVSMANNLLTLNWKSVLGKWYTVQVTDNLSSATSWRSIGTAIPGTGETVSASFTDTANTYTTGSVARRRWKQASNLSLATVKANVTNNVTPQVADFPTMLDLENGSLVAFDYTGNYVEGWITPTTTGNYRLFLATDDQGELWFASNPDSPYLRRIAYIDTYTGYRQWTNLPSQMSGVLPLTAGRRYAFRVYMQNGTGGYNTSVGWRLDTQPNTAITVIGSANIARGYPSLKDYNLLLANGLYARVEVHDADSDNDSLTDYEEGVLGLNAALAQSTPRTNDLDAAVATLASSNTVTAGASALRAYEAELEPGIFTIFRSGGIDPLTVNYTIAGTATGGADYPVQTGTVRIPLGKKSLNVPIMPTADGVLEPAETVELNVASGGSTYALGNPVKSTITIDDAKDRLFIAPIRGLVTDSKASGYAALRMAGNKVFSVFSLNFTNLTSPETSAQLYITESGQPDKTVLTFSAGQVAKQTWTFPAAGGATTPQIIAALEQGRMHIRLCTENTPVGEAGGTFLANLGWQVMPTPPAPPAYTPGLTDAEAGRFLVQCTFGPRTADITYLQGKGTYTAWLNEQINTLPATLHTPYVLNRRAEYLAADPNSDGWQRPRQEAFWEASMKAPDQLRQRMALALSEIFVVSDVGVLDGSHVPLTNWYDMLVTNAFGNYRELLEKVTLSPMMGQYLSMVLNQQEDVESGVKPDENYAREVQQLFSIGLYLLNLDGSARLDADGLPIPTYRQADISTFARVFTGWGYYGTTGYYRYPYTLAMDMNPMVQFPEYHDKGPKTLHNGVVIPANTSGEAELEIAMDNLFNHPNTGPFISRQLIQRFVTSNPSPGYIYRVASVFNNNGSNVRGDLGAVIRAVLLDYEARNPVVAQSQSFGKLKEPLLRLTHMYRAADVTPPDPADHWYGAGYNSSDTTERLFLDLSYSISQAALKSPSVFNFFQPGYIPPGRMASNGLYAPEFQIFSETSALGQINLQDGAMSWGTWTGERNSADTDYLITRMAFNQEVTLLNQIRTATTDTTQPYVYDFTPLINHLNKELLAGQMSANLRSRLQTYFAAANLQDYGWFNLNNADSLREHAVFAFHIVLASPEFAVQK